jgi:hypothetical protein
MLRHKVQIDSEQRSKDHASGLKVKPKILIEFYNTAAEYILLYSVYLYGSELYRRKIKKKAEDRKRERRKRTREKSDAVTAADMF